MARRLAARICCNNLGYQYNAYTMAVYPQKSGQGKVGQESAGLTSAQWPDCPAGPGSRCGKCSPPMAP